MVVSTQYPESTPNLIFSIFQPWTISCLRLGSISTRLYCSETQTVKLDRHDTGNDTYSSRSGYVSDVDSFIFFLMCICS